MFGCGGNFNLFAAYNWHIRALYIYLHTYVVYLHICVATSAEVHMRR